MDAFNMTSSNLNLVSLTSDYGPQNLLSRPKCFKSANPFCIDNFLTTREPRFMKILTLETGISDLNNLSDAT